MKHLDVLFAPHISFRQKYFFFRWPHPWFWGLLFRNKRWQAYVAANVRQGCLVEARWWGRWIPSIGDIKGGLVTFSGTERKCAK